MVPASILLFREGEMSLLSLLNYLGGVCLKKEGKKATTQPLVLKESCRTAEGSWLWGFLVCALLIPLAL